MTVTNKCGEVSLRMEPEEVKFGRIVGKGWRPILIPKSDFSTGPWEEAERDD